MSLAVLSLSSRGLRIILAADRIANCELDFPVAKAIRTRLWKEFEVEEGEVSNGADSILLLRGTDNWGSRSS